MLKEYGEKLKYKGKEIIGEGKIYLEIHTLSSETLEER